MLLISKAKSSADAVLRISIEPKECKSSALGLDRVIMLVTGVGSASSSSCVKAVHTHLVGWGVQLTTWAGCATEIGSIVSKATVEGGWDGERAN